MKIPSSNSAVLFHKLSTPDMRFYAFAAFLVIVFLTGGGSRDDIQSLIILRPLAILFCAYAITVKAADQWKGRMFPLYIAWSLAALMAIQLIPLPPSIWSAMAGREIFAEIADMAQIEQPWRPVTLSPSKTLNSLFSLSVPIAAMMLYLNLEEGRRRQAIVVFISLALVSLVWAAFQLSGSLRSPLYLYQITNNGSPVGLFANRNHQAVMLVIAIVMLGWYAASDEPEAKFTKAKLYGGIAMIFVILPLIFVTGSRAGLLLMAPALVAAIILIYFRRYLARKRPAMEKGEMAKSWLSSQKVFIFSMIVATVALATMAVYFSRSLALDRLVGSSEVEEMRIQLLPTLTLMVREYFPWGSGFGTFEHVYRIYEPHELLNAAYLNQAHNDWIQFFIEGGVAAMLVGFVAIGWGAMQFIRVARTWRMSRNTKYTAAMAMTVVILLLLASLGDYPLRVPSMMAIFAVFACILNDAVRSLGRRITNHR